MVVLGYSRPVHTSLLNRSRFQQSLADFTPLALCFFCLCTSCNLSHQLFSYVWSQFCSFHTLLMFPSLQPTKLHLGKHLHFNHSLLWTTSTNQSRPHPVHFCLQHTLSSPSGHACSLHIELGPDHYNPIKQMTPEA